MTWIREFGHLGLYGQLCGFARLLVWAHDVGHVGLGSGSPDGMEKLRESLAGWRARSGLGSWFGGAWWGSAELLGAGYRGLVVALWGR